MVNAAVTLFVRLVVTAPRYDTVMQQFFIADRRALNDAFALVDEFGVDAPVAAAERANRSRDLGNVGGFCHWRQLERVTALLTSDQVVGDIH